MISDESQSCFCSSKRTSSVKDEESSDEFESRIEPLILKLSKGNQNKQLEEKINSDFEEENKIKGREEVEDLVDIEDKDIEEGEYLVLKTQRDGRK